MDFTKPVKLNNECIHSEINNPIHINSQDELDDLQNKVIDIITEKSLEWFNKTFTKEDIVKKMTKKEYINPVQVKGINFFKTNFELDIQDISQPEQNFFETIVDNVVDIFTGEPVQQTVQDYEPVQQILQESVSEPVQESIVENDKVLQQLLHEEHKEEHEEHKEEHEEHKEEQTEEHKEEEQEYTLGQKVEVLVGNLWTNAKIVSYEDESYTVMFNNGKKMTGFMSDDIREIRKITYNKTIKRIKNEIVDAYENKDLEKAYKLSKILKQLI